MLSIVMTVENELRCAGKTRCRRRVYLNQLISGPVDDLCCLPIVDTVLVGSDPDNGACRKCQRGALPVQLLLQTIFLVQVDVDVLELARPDSSKEPPSREPSQ